MEIADEDSLYTRFCRSGTVRQIVDAKGNTYLIREHISDGEKKDGFGLAQEFGIDGPVGYDGKTPFLKPGVGWLLPDGNSYRFMNTYPLLAPGSCMRKQLSESSAEVSWKSGRLPGSPYACEYLQSFLLEGNGIRIRTKFTNTGTASFALSEYCHNFLAVNRRSFPQEYMFWLFSGNRTVDRTDLIHFPGYPGYHAYPASENAWCGELTGWKLENGSLAISEQVDFKPDKFAVWGMEHVFSPELFIRFTLNPGEDAVWTRSYRIGSE